MTTKIAHQDIFGCIEVFHHGDNQFSVSKMVAGVEIDFASFECPRLIGEDIEDWHERAGQEGFLRVAFL